MFVSVADYNICECQSLVPKIEETKKIVMTTLIKMSITLRANQRPGLNIEKCSQVPEVAREVLVTDIMELPT